MKAWNSVVPEKLASAEALLADKAFVGITEQQVRDLASESPPTNQRGVPYLLRAVGDAGGTFSLEVFVRPNGDVWIGGGANSRCPVAMKRRAIIAWLEKSPNEVYLTFVVGK